MDSPPRRLLASLTARGSAAWRGLRLGLAVLLPLASGCHSFEPVAKAPAPPKTLTMPGLADHPFSKADFHREVSPDQHYNVHLEMGRAYESQGYYEAAIAEYQKSLDACARLGRGHGERPALVQRRMGGALDRLGRFAQAETHYRAALKLSPDDPKVWNDAGYSYYLQGRWADAERCLKTATRLDPENPRYQTNLGLALAASGRTDEALASLTKAGGPAVGNANLGYLLASIGKTDEARRYYGVALQLQPDLAPVRQALVTLEAQQVKATQLAAASPPALPRASDPEIRRASAVSPSSIPWPSHHVPQ